MTTQQLLLEGVELMLFGLGLVFLFLVLLILCIQLIAKSLERLGLHETHEAVVAAALSATAAPIPAAQIDQDTLSAIEIAIKQHRARHN